MKLLPPWRFVKKALRILLFTLATLITLTLLLASWLSFQGRREWHQTKQALLARGEKLSLPELAPPPIPDQLNFYADPLWTKAASKEDSEALESNPHLSLLSQKPDLNEITFLKRQFPAFSDLDYNTSREAIASRALWHADNTKDRVAQQQLPAFLLHLLQPLFPLLNHVEKLLDRPSARSSWDLSDPFAVHTEIGSLLTLSNVYYLRALAYARSGETVWAYDDIRAVFRLSEISASDPFMICHLIRLSQISMALVDVNEGIKSHLWSEEQLASFMKILSRQDVLRTMKNGLQAERGFFNQAMELLLLHQKPFLEIHQIFTNQEPAKQTPLQGYHTLIWQAAGFTYCQVFAAADQAYFNRAIQDYINAFDAAQGRGLSSSIEDDYRLKSESRNARYLFSSLILPALSGSFKRTAHTQDSINQTLIACALERYRLAHGEYPASLSALIPSYLPSLPPSIMNLTPMHYERTAPDHFRLWSDGWNGTNENGTPTSRKLHDADWVWAERLKSP